MAAGSTPSGSTRISAQSSSSTSESLNENVINQGLLYLDWLLDHQAEFALLAMKSLGNSIEAKIDWPGTRLICIAADFTRYDEHAVSQINRNIELIRYKSYGTDLLLLEQVNTGTGTAEGPSSTGGKTQTVYKGVSEYLNQAPADLANLYQELDAFLVALGDVQVKTTKQYVAYRRIKNFACVEVHPQSKKLLVFVKVDPDTVTLEVGYSRDVRKIGHFGTGDLELTIDSADGLERSKPMLAMSYERS